MTAPHDPDRLIRTFLDEGRSELPDRTYDALRMQIDRTRQRAVIGPWRVPDMSNLARFAAAATAVVAVAIAGMMLLGGRGQDPIGSAGGSASPTAEPTPRTYDWPLELAPGTYETRLSWSRPVVFRFTVPSGWVSRDVEILGHGGVVALQLYFADNVYADPCGEGLQDPPIGPSVDDFVTGLTSVPGLDWTVPRQATLAGYEGTRVVLQEPRDLPCDPTEFRVVHFEPQTCRAGCGGLGAPAKSLSDETPSPESERVWVLDVDGNRLVVDAVVTPNATQAHRDELQGILDSLEIFTFTPTQAPRPSGS